MVLRYINLNENELVRAESSVDFSMRTSFSRAKIYGLGRKSHSLKPNTFVKLFKFMFAPLREFYLRGNFVESFFLAVLVDALCFFTFSVGTIRSVRGNIRLMPNDTKVPKSCAATS